MRGKRFVGGLLALVMCLSLTVNVRAADIYGSKLLHKGVSATLTHYVEYTYCGKTYRSDQTGGITNYKAWQQMTTADKRAVVNWFGGFAGQLNRQFSGAGDMRAFAEEKNGWKQAGEKLRDRLASANYPQLRSFYGGPDNGLPRELLLTDGVRAQLSPEELERYDSAANAYGVLYRTGLDAYNKLIQLKQYQVNVAVTAISSGLIDLIMKYAMPPRLDEVVETLEDELKGYVKDAIGIEDAAKDLLGIKKLTGEDKRIEAEKAAKAIELYWNLMCLQEKLADYCRRKCGDQLALVRQLQGNYESAAAAREAEIAAAKAARQQSYSDAVNAEVALVDYDPEIDVQPVEGETLEAYDARRLAAARAWAQAQYDDEKQRFAAYCAGYYNYYDTGTMADSHPARMHTNDRWLAFGQSSTYYTRFFGDYLGMVKREELSGLDENSLKSPEELFVNYSELFDAEKYTGYDDAIRAVYDGFDSAIAALEGFEAEIRACIAAREQVATDARTGAVPYRSHVFSLTESHCKHDQGYGNWGISDDCWTAADNDFRALCEAMRQEAEKPYNDLESLQAELKKVRQYKADYQRRQAEFEASLQSRYDVYAYTQGNLDYGLSQVMSAIGKLEALQDSYPSWLKNHRYMLGQNKLCSYTTGVESEELYQLYFKGKTVSQQLQVIEETLLPMLEDYQTRENELLDQLERGRAFLDAAARERTDENNVIMGTVSELDNLNRMSLGGLTIQNHISMFQDYGYYDYLYHLKNFPQQTPVLGILIDDLRGEGAHMIQMRELYGQLLENRGDYLRQAQAHTLDRTAVFAKYGLTNAPDALRNDANYRSYNSNAVWYFWYDNIKPVMVLLDEIDSGYQTYQRVTSLTKGGSRVPQSPGTPGDTPDVTLQLGETQVLSVTVEPADATVRDVVWSSSDTAVATVTESPDDSAVATVTALLPGTVTVTATAADSESDSRISREFTVVVKAGEYASLQELGDGYYVLSPQVATEPGQLTVSALLGTNGAADPDTELGSGNEFLNATALLAAFDGDRFLGCSAQDCIPYNGELCALNGTIPLAATPVNTPDVKLFLAEQGVYQPAAGYTPLALNTPAGEPAAPAGDPDSGIYGVSDGAVITRIATAAGEAVTAGATDGLEGFYPGGERFSVTCPDTVSGSAYTLYVVKGDGVPTAENLYYIGQKTADGASLTFDGVLPRVMQEGRYKVYVVGEGRALDTAAPLAVFSYHSMARWDLTVLLQSADAGASVTLTRNGNTVPGAGGLNARLLNGHYTMTVTRDGCAAYTKEFDLQSDMTLNVPALVKWGNVNGAADNGLETSVTDMACLFTWLSANRNEGQIADEAYFRQVCDVNGDGAVDILDYQALYAGLQAA